MSAKAVCVINGEAKGIIYFVQNGDTITITGEISGLQPGLHGFHVHQYGDNTNGCISAGSHYNPTNQDHGAPNAKVRHVGDLGNIHANESGIAKVSIVDKIMKISGEYSVIGRTLVVHAEPDDLGLGGHELSKSTGNSGARFGCGVIGIAEL